MDGNDHIPETVASFGNNGFGIPTVRQRDGIAEFKASFRVVANGHLHVDSDAELDLFVGFLAKVVLIEQRSENFLDGFARWKSVVAGDVGRGQLNKVFYDEILYLEADTFWRWSEASEEFCSRAKCLVDQAGIIR